MADPTLPEPRFDRSPSFPFISLRKAEERAKQFWAAHRKDDARLSVLAHTWGYGAKSSGLQQTVGALKQYGLLEDIGSGAERKVQLTELGRRLVADQRPGAVDAARKEAALRPRLFQEYRRWINEMPSPAHCLSELELDRGFNPSAAYTFLKSFSETISFARLRDDDTLSPSLDGDEASQEQSMEAEVRGPHNDIGMALTGAPGPAPTRTPQSAFKVEINEQSLVISATLLTGEDVKKLVSILEATGGLLPPGDATKTN